MSKYVIEEWSEVNIYGIPYYDKLIQKISK